MMEEISILTVLAFIIFASPYIAKIFKIPISPTEIALGIGFGSIGLLPHIELFKAAADLGFYYLMFLAGSEVDMKIFIRTPKNTLKKAFLFTAIMYILAVIITLLFGISPLYIVIIPIISIGILSTLYKEYGKDESWLNLAMLVGVIGEIVSIALLTVLSGYLKHGFGVDLFLNLGVLVLFLVAVGLLFKGLEVLFWWFPALKKVLMPDFDKSEKDIRLSMALFLFVIAMMIVIDLKVVLGAFIAGTFIPTFFDHKKDLPQKLSSFGFGFLIPVFFAYIGSTINLKALLNVEILLNIAFIMGSIIAVRLLAGLVFLKNLGKKGAVLFSVSLSMPLTLLVAVATMGIESNGIDENTYYALIITSLLSAVLCLILIKIIYFIGRKNG